MGKRLARLFGTAHKFLANYDLAQGLHWTETTMFKELSELLTE